MRLLSLFLKRRTLVFAIALLMIVLGGISIKTLPVDFLPNIDYPLIKVHIWWKNASPTDIDRYISDIVEREVAGVEGLDYLESTAIEGSYTLKMNFKYGRNRDVAFQDSQAALNRALRKLPKDIEPPVVIKADPQQLPIIRVSISSSVWKEEALTEWVDEWLVPRIMAVSGVSGVDLNGGKTHEIRVNPNIGAMQKYNITVDELANAIKNSNIELFSGRVTYGKTEYIARTSAEYVNLNDIRDVVVKRRGNAVVRLGDIAKVIDSFQEVRIITRFNSIPCVNLYIYKNPDFNTVKVAKAVQNKLSQLNKLVEKHIVFSTYESQADYVANSMKSVKYSAVEAIFLVILVAFIFLGSLRQSLVLILALPLIIISSFSFMNLMGFSLNIFTLAGLIIATGMALDNSIVIVESISRVDKKGKDSIQKRVLKLIAPLLTPLTASAFTILALFVPFVIVNGLTSLLFRELVITISGIIVISVFVALFIVPVISIQFMKKKHKVSMKKKKKKFFNLSKGYVFIISLLMRFRWLVLFATIVLITLTYMNIKKPGTEFLPDIDDGRILIKVKLPTGSALSTTTDYLSQIEKFLQKEKLIEHYSTLSGGKTWGLYTFEVPTEGQIDIQLIPPAQRSVSVKQFIKKLRKKLKKIKIAGGKIMVKKMRIKGIRKMGTSDLEIQVKGTELKTLYKIASTIKQRISTLPQLKNVYLGMDASKPELFIKVDKAKAHLLGITSVQVANTVRNMVGGVVASHLRHKDRFYNIRLKIPEQKLTSTEVLLDIPIRTASGKIITVGDIATIKHNTGPVEIVRDNQMKLVVVRADLGDTSLGNALSILKREIGKIKLPPGYEINYAGKARLMKDISSSYTNIFFFALFFSFIILSIQFNRFRYALLILITLPLSVLGSVVAMSISGYAIGGTVMLGIIIVVSAHINDSVLLFAETETRLKSGKKLYEIITDSAVIRAKPRIMTTLTTIAGFTPLIFSRGEGADLLAPMAVAAIGGLFFEILANLILLPVFFTFVCRKPDKIKPNENFS